MIRQSRVNLSIISKQLNCNFNRNSVTDIINIDYKQDWAKDTTLR